MNLGPLSHHLDDFLSDLDTSTHSRTILSQIHDENLEKLIVIRERSLQLSLKTVNSHSHALLNETFSFKNLKVKPITWNDSSAGIVEFIGKNDLVRPSENWEALKKRLDGKMFKCYGMFHEKLRMPVSFVYIKLQQGLPSTLHNIYEHDTNSLDSSKPDSCIFYSISSPLKGLNGIEFGSKLIKSVVEVVKSENSQIRTFATFSPIPLFRHWLTKHSTRFAHLSHLSAEQLEAHEKELMEACGEYLRTKFDPVARFHYRNGAKLGPIRFKADPSLQSFTQSYGIQVNYIYYE